MFVIDPQGDTDTTFWAPVTLRLPGGDEHKIKLEFVELTDEEIDAIYDGGGLDADVIKAAAKNWSGVYEKAAEGKPQKVDFSPEELDRLCGHRWFRTAVINTYVNHLSGRGVVKRAERQRKNS